MNHEKVHALKLKAFRKKLVLILDSNRLSKEEIEKNGNLLILYKYTATLYNLNQHSLLAIIKPVKIFKNSSNFDEILSEIDKFLDFYGSFWYKFLKFIKVI